MRILIALILAVPFFIFAIIAFSNGNVPMAILFIILDAIFLIVMKKIINKNR
jgi:hypothetical protein